MKPSAKQVRSFIEQIPVAALPQLRYVDFIAPISDPQNVKKELASLLHHLRYSELKLDTRSLGSACKRLMHL